MFNELNNLNKKSLLKIIAIIILSDGTMDYKNKKYIRLSTSKINKCQHEIFKFLCNKLFNKNPNVCNIKLKSGFNGKIEDLIQSTLNSKEAIIELLRLNPNYKTTPGKMSKEEFLSFPQPTVKFLFKESNKLKWLALRMWFDFDGSIIPSFRLKNKKDKKLNKIYNYYQVQFECDIRISETNSNLFNDLQRLCSDLNLRASKKTRDNWSGIDGINISRLNDVKKFVLHGPISNVKISDKSPRFSGVEKKKVCLAVGKILENESIKKSMYFKNENDAINYKNKMNELLFNMIKS